MLSGASDYTMVRDGYQLGAVTFVVKPLTCEEVLRTFKNLRGVTFQPDGDGYVIVPSAAAERMRPSNCRSICVRSTGATVERWPGGGDRDRTCKDRGLSPARIPIPPRPRIWCPWLDSNQHCPRFEGGDSCRWST